VCASSQQEVVLEVDESAQVHLGIVSVPIEERWGRDWDDENQTAAGVRVYRLLLDVLR
jgi:hypothetical protein